MNYELAKQLGAAGFSPTEDRVWVNIQHRNGWQVVDAYYLSDRGPFGEEDHETPAPTLSELIRACVNHIDELGNKGGFALIESDQVEWEAYIGFDLDDYTEREIGGTPEEAVARLWLALSSSNSVSPAQPQ